MFKLNYETAVFNEIFIFHNYEVPRRQNNEENYKLIITTHAYELVNMLMLNANLQ